MFKSKTLRNIIAFLLAGIVLTFTACSSDDDVTETKYSGPGSQWDTTFRSNGTFTLIKYPNSTSTTAEMTVNGTYVNLATGFKKLTVTDATGTDAPVAGDLAYGIEVPGYVFVLKPMGSGDQIIPMITAGSCPTTDFTANWVMVNLNAGATVATTDMSGTFEYVAATSAVSLPTKYNVSGTSNGAGTVGSGTGTCSNGIMNIDGTIDLFLTTSGGAIVNTDTVTSTNAEYVFAFTQRAISDINTMDGTYAGLVFNDSSSAGNKITPVKLVCAAGSCTGNGYADIEAGTFNAGTVTLNLQTPDTPSNGLVLGTISEGGPAGNVICTIDNNVGGTGRIIGSCAGEDPGNVLNMFNVLFTKI